MKINFGWMAQRVALGLGLLALGWGQTRAELPPAELLLPDDVTLVATVKDLSQSHAALRASAFGKFLADPEMKPFMEKLGKKFSETIASKASEKSTVKWGDYVGLLQGQATFALKVRIVDEEPKVGLVGILDVKEKTELLDKLLEEVAKEVTVLRREKLRDVEFMVFALTNHLHSGEVHTAPVELEEEEDPAEAEPAEPEPEMDEEVEVTEVFVGRSNSMLLVSQDKELMEKTLSRQQGSLLAPLADSDLFSKANGPEMRGALAYGWLNFKQVYEMMEMAATLAAGASDNPMAQAFRPEKVLPALGLKAVESISFSASVNAEGSGGWFSLRAPESERRGLLKFMELAREDTQPPAFVPADVTTYTRARFDAQKSWAAIEQAVSDIDPSMAGMLQFALSSVGKDKDPNFDLKKNFIGNMGSDIIVLEKPPRDESLEALGAPPALFLIGSPNAEQLADAVRMVASMLPGEMASAPLKDREFLGRKVYSIAFETPDAEGAPRKREFSFAASGGYLALGMDTGFLEEYLRSAEQDFKKLREVSSLNDHVDRVGGFKSGFLSYQDMRSSGRVAWEMLRKNPDMINEMFGAGLQVTGANPGDLREWIDPALLPEFSKISKYFSPTLVGGGATAEGISFKVFSPMPPGL